MPDSFGYKTFGSVYGPFDNALDAAKFGKELHDAFAIPHGSVEIGPAGEVVPLYDPNGDLFAPFRKRDMLAEIAQAANGS